METTQKTETSITENTEIKTETATTENTETKTETTTTENTETKPEATATTEKETNIAERIENDNNANENIIIEISKSHVLFTAMKTIADIQKMTISSCTKGELNIANPFMKYIKVEDGALYFISNHVIAWTDDPAIVRNGIKDGIYIINKNTSNLIQLIKVKDDIRYPNFKDVINRNTNFNENDDKVNNFYLVKSVDMLSTFIAKIYYSLVNKGNEKKMAVNIKHIEYFTKNLKGNNVSFAHQKNNCISYLECKEKYMYSVFCGYVL